MTSNDTERLFTLLKLLYSNTKVYDKENIQFAWQLVLEPYDYDDVKEAVLKISRKKGPPPLVQEIVDLIPKPAPADPDPDQSRDKVSETAVIENVASWAAVMGEVMPLGLTAREAMDWFQERKMRV